MFSSWSVRITHGLRIEPVPRLNPIVRRVINLERFFVAIAPMGSEIDFTWDCRRGLRRYIAFGHLGALALSRRNRNFFYVLRHEFRPVYITRRLEVSTRSAFANRIHGLGLSESIGYRWADIACGGR